MSDAVYDTFTAANGTLLVAHVGETGATWTVDNVFGAAVPGAFVIHTNMLRRPTFAEDPASDGGEALVRPSGLLPGSSHFTIECGVIFDVVGFGYGFVAFYEQAINPGNPYLLAQVSYNNSNYLNATGAGSFSFTPVAAHEYIVLLDVNGTTLTLSIDGVVKGTGTRTTMPAEPFGIDLGDGSSYGQTHLTYFRITPVTPSAFWQDFTQSQEIIA